MRKTAIPKREIRVLERLREAREKLGLSQPEFAQQIDITRAKLANFENLKTPLPCDLALQICHQFIIGERWLAAGQGPMRQFIDLSLFVSNPALYRKPFGEAYDTNLAVAADKRASGLDFMGGSFIFSEHSYWNINEQFYKNYLNMLLDCWLELLKKKGKQEDFGKLAKALADSGYDLLHGLLDQGIPAQPKK